ncbi:MAG: nodulation protein NfeD [Puniceicoccaceae bacterium]
MKIRCLAILISFLGAGLLVGDEAEPSVVADPFQDQSGQVPAIESDLEDQAPSTPAVTPYTDPVNPLARPGEKRKVYVVPIEGPIFRPTFFILRRALKEAILEDADILIDMNTPGGQLNVTLEIMQALDRFEGNSITFINDEAVSAGAFITFMTDRIFFEPRGVIGAAEPVTAGGGDVNEGMKRKLESYLSAKITALTSEFPQRANILRAMFEPDFELVIDGKVLSDKGRLLSLTADQAMELYGDPPSRLLADGIANSIEEVLIKLYGEDGYELVTFEVSWSENLAQYLKNISPLLISVGLLLLFTEFKTPGFGIFGVLGIISLSLVFVANSVAGLAGYEVGIILVLGLLLVAVEIFILPGTLIPGLVGMLLVVGSFLWSLADIWPAQGDGGPTIVWSSVFDGIQTLGISAFLLIIGMIALLYYIPRSRFFDRLSVNLVSGGSIVSTLDAFTGESSPRPQKTSSLVGKTGIVTRPLVPTGQIEIEGKRHTARSLHGSIPSGTSIEVIEETAFHLTVTPSKLS